MSDTSSTFNIENISIVKKVETNNGKILSICPLEDERIAISSLGEITIYNLEKDKIDFVIKGNNEDKNILSLMRNGNLLSCCNGEIIIYKIKEDSYEVIDKIENLGGNISKAIELHNRNIIILGEGYYVFKKGLEEKKYVLEEKRLDGYHYNDGYQINDNIIALVTQQGKMIKYFDENSWIIPKIVVSYQNYSSFNNCLLKYDSDYFIIGGDKKLYLINLGDYRTKQQLDVQYEICSICRVNGNVFLTTGKEGTITQWKIENNEIIKQYEKENLVTGECRCLVYLDNGKILMNDSNKLVILQ